jgi:hypothetical protein
MDTSFLFLSEKKKTRIPGGTLVTTAWSGSCVVECWAVKVVAAVRVPGVRLLTATHTLVTLHPTQH